MAWNDKFEIEDPEMIDQIKGYMEEASAAGQVIMDMARKQRVSSQMLWSLVKEKMGDAYDEKRHYKLATEDGKIVVVDRGPAPSNDYD